MSKKVLLIVPPVRLSQTPNRFPLGLGYIASSLENANIEVNVLDLNILRLSEKLEERRVAEAIKGKDIVGMGGMITMLNTIARITSYVKKYQPQIPVVVGGPLASNFQEMILHNTQIDILVMGEGELIIPELVTALPDVHALEQINGMAFLQDGDLFLTPAQNRIQDLDLIPKPAYHLFPFETYIINRSRRRVADIIGSRGCPFKCTFCFRNFGNKVFFRSVDNLIDEIEYLKDIYQIERIHLEDELFVQRKGYVKKFCNEIQKIGGIVWSACARVDTLSLDLLQEMKAAGCELLMVGIESFSDERLTEMRKKIRREQIDQVCHWMNQVGIEISPGLIIGMPNESKESIQSTVDGCIRHRIPISEWAYAFATPYPGTELYSEAKKAGLITSDWDYIQRLCDVGDTCDLAINLTQFTDSELIRLRNKAIKAVTKAIGPSLLKRSAKFLQRCKRAARRRISPVKRKMKAFCGIDVTPFRCVRKNHFRDDLDNDKAREFFKQTVNMVEIEVFSFCNRKCWFCSNTYVDRHSENIFMHESLYSKIISNLKEIDYSNHISYSRYNEPLADKIILNRLREAREALPNATLRINTNGDYLEQNYLEELYEAGLRHLNIQVYLPGKTEYTDEVAARYAVSMIKRFSLPYRFRFKKPGEWLEYNLDYRDMAIRLYARNFVANGTDRGKIVDSIESDAIRKSPCLIPFHDLYIDYNGKVVPCCNIRSDWPDHSEYVLGDLSKEESIFSVFTSTTIVSWRKVLINYDGKEPPCDSCRFEEIDPTAENMRRAKKWSKHTREKQT